MCESVGAQIVLPIAAGAPPSGPVEDAAFEYIAQKIVAAAAEGCDAIMLDLHGAMATKTYDDGEGELLRRIREVAPNVPIAVALDMHANLYPEMVARADVIAGYQTYPHIDMDETAERAGRALLKMLDGSAKPTMVWGNAPMLPHVMRQGTDDFPNAQLQARAREMEQRRRIGRQPVHRLSACRHRTGRPVGGRSHRRRQASGGDLARRAARSRVERSRCVRVSA